MAGASSGDLVGLGVYFPLGAHAPGGHVEHRQQVHLAAVGADGAADGLAVHSGLFGQPWQSGAGGGPGGPALLPLVPGHGRQGARRAGGQRGQVAVQRRVERLRVDALEDPREGADTGRPDPPRPRVAAPAQDGQRLRHAAGRPLRDGFRRVVPGRGERADRQPQHELQQVPPAQPRAGVRDQGQPATQAAA
ncbi:MAG TPA: hypothetical protein VG123_02810 [Streptosporangiaceae bacterium]|nr:hypothetical protein [Streptosporangiaceae bacterium]